MTNPFEQGQKKQEISPKEERVHPDYDLIAEKLLISRGTTTEEFGSPNVHRAVEKLYASLYEPERVEELVKPNEKFPDRIKVMKSPLSSQPAVVPEKEEFIKKVRHAMTKETDFSKCFSKEARIQLKSVMEKCESTVIWTDGDALGVPEHQLPGSYEQICRIGSAKFFNQIRREIAQRRGVDHREVLSVVAVEGKMKFIPGLMDEFEKRGIERTIIVEDRVKNLNSATDLARNNSAMEIFPVWVRQGQFKNKLEGKTEEELRDYHPIRNISELMPLLEASGVFEEGKKVGAIFDMDGVLSDDDIRKVEQTKAVVKALKEKGWI